MTSTSVEQPALTTLVAHELREPLGVLHGYLSMVEAGDLTADDRSAAVAVMHAKVVEMANLVDGLLTATRLDAGGLAPLPVQFDVRWAVDEAIAVVCARAALVGATIHTTSPAQPIRVRVDRDHVVRILVNLFANAISYGPAPARIEVEVRPGDPVELAVSDNGIGIPGRSPRARLPALHASRGRGASRRGRRPRAAAEPRARRSERRDAGTGQHGAGPGQRVRAATAGAGEGSPE